MSVMWYLLRCFVGAQTGLWVTLAYILCGWLSCYFRRRLLYLTGYLSLFDQIFIFHNLQRKGYNFNSVWGDLSTKRDLLPIANRNALLQGKSNNVSVYSTGFIYLIWEKDTFTFYCKNIRGNIIDRVKSLGNTLSACVAWCYVRKILNSFINVC